MNVVSQKLETKTLDSSPKTNVEQNLLYRLCSIASVPLGVMLLMGAYGHFSAVRPVLIREIAASDVYFITLWLPVLVFVAAGVVNIGLCMALWSGKLYSVKTALWVNIITALYLAYLLQSNVTDHPIGVFLALVVNYNILLAAITLGFVWPSKNT